jgi:hypothetical protein
MIRANPSQTSNANYQAFIGNVDQIEFLDKSSSLVAFGFSKKLNQYIMADSFNSDFIASYPTGGNIWYLPFNLTPSGADNGLNLGSYVMSTDEQIRIHCGSGFVGGSYEVCVWGAMYGYFDILYNGEVLFTK